MKGDLKAFNMQREYEIKNLFLWKDVEQPEAPVALTNLKIDLRNT